VLLLLRILFLNNTAEFSWPKYCRSVNLTTHLRLVVCYRMRGAVLPFPIASPCRAQQ
jgi:hypothetical protein